MNNCYIKETNKNNIGEINLSNTIYKNFLYLKDTKHLKHNINEIENLLQSENFLGFFAYDSKNLLIGYLIGEITLLNDGRLIFFITYFYVSSKHRKNGYGKLLLDKCVNRCRQKGLSFVSLTCNGNNNYIMNYYDRYGFVKDSILKKQKPYVILTLYL